MNRTFLLAAIAATSLLLFMSGATPVRAQPSVAGLWEQVDEDGRVGAWFYFFERNGVYFGAIAKTFPAPGEKSETICTKCPGDQKNAPMIGLIIVNGMQRKGLSYENGKILDPRDGSIYRAVMDLSVDGQKLTVRGYLGFEVLGRSQVWRRLPDNAMQQPGSSPAGSQPPSGTVTRPERPVSR